MSWSQVGQGLCLAVLVLAATLPLPAPPGFGGQGGIVAPAAAGQEAHRDEIGVTVEGGLLIIRVEEERLDDVLRAIAEQANLRLKLTGDLGGPTTAWFTVHLEDGLRHLVGNHGLIMLYGPPHGSSGRQLLTEIWVRGALDGPVVTVEPAATGDDLAQFYFDLERFDREGKLRAVRAIAGFDDAAAIADLALVLERESDPLVRRVAAIGLGHRRGADAIDALGAALEDRDRSVRFQAIHGLGKIGGRDAAEALVPALRDGDAAIRLQAVLALQSTGDASTVRALARVLAEDADAEVRRVAARTLERIGGPDAWWVLFDASTDRDPMIRRDATAAMAP